MEARPGCGARSRNRDRSRKATWRRSRRRKAQRHSLSVYAAAPHSACNRSSPEVTKPGRPCEIRLDVLAAALVDDFPAQRFPGVGHAVAGRREIHTHVVHALSEHDGDRVESLAEDDDIEHLSGCGHADLNLVLCHGQSSLAQCIHNGLRMLTWRTSREPIAALG